MSEPPPRPERRRTRLRSGKLADGENRFLAHCQIVNRSLTGARLRLIDDIEVPDDCRLYDDERGLLVAVRIKWQHGRELGVQFVACNSSEDELRHAATAFAGPFYALKKAR